MRFVIAATLFFAIATPALADAPVAPKPQAAAPPPAGIWRLSEGRGYEHVQSGMICPDKLGDRRRRQVEIFDEFGLDVGCDYSGPTSGVTYYLTRRQRGGIPEAMAEAKSELLDAAAARRPQLVSESLEQWDGQDWAVVLYGEDAAVTDGIWMADIAGWTLEFRVTYRTADQSRIAEEVKDSAKTILKDVGARLVTCAKAAPAERRGRAITDKAAIESASMMTSVLGGALAAGLQKKDANAGDPTFRCAEQAIQHDGMAMLYWRSIRPDGSDALYDEISVELNDGPLAMSFTSGLLGLIADQAKDKTDREPHWSASVDRGGRNLIFGYFWGRPTIEDMGGLFEAALTGKSKPVGGYSAKGNAITIITPPK